MAMEIRQARADELDRLQQLIVVSINDLTRRHGFGELASVRPAAFQQYFFDRDPGGFFIAEDEEGLVGSAFSWVCGDLWFLAELFIAPRLQGGGTGRELLRRTLRHADQANAKTRALITFTFNTVSQGLYLRHGMFPRLPVYMFGAERGALANVVPDPQLEFRRVGADESDVATLAAIDRDALGVSRDQHHRYLLNEPAVKGFLLHDGGVCIGYAYVAATGHVGPLAVTRRELMAPAFRGALRIAFLPGTCEASLRVAAEHRMRIALPMVLVSDRAFGDWQRYLPRNPGFM
jgi:GNAT superfamily N-acetyltransferase